MKKYKVFNNFLTCLLIASILFAIYSGITNIPALCRLDREYEECLQVETECLKKQEELSKYTLEDKKRLAEQKAHEENFLYPNEIIFYETF